MNEVLDERDSALLEALSDERLLLISDSLRALQEGRATHLTSIGGDDDIGRLARQVNCLASALQRRATEERVLAQVVDHVAAASMFDDVLERVHDALRNLIPFDRMGCALLSEHSAILTLDWLKTVDADVRMPLGYSAPIKSSGLMEVAKSGHPRILNDLPAHLAQRPRSHATRLLVAEGMSASLTCPLLFQQRTIGFLFFSTRAPFAYQPEHAELIERLIAPLSMLIDKSRLYQEVYETNLRLIHTQHQLREQTTRDELTGLFNRRAILEQLDKELARSRRHRMPIAVAKVDIDNLGRINEQHGSHAGEVVLRSVARRLCTAIRRSDTIGRYGSEEFLALLPDASIDGAQRSAERLREAIARGTVGFDGKDIAATVSLGVVVAKRAEGITAEHLVRAAEEKLLAAKNAGSNRTELRILG